MPQRVLVGVAVIALAAIVALYLAIVRSQGGAPIDTPWVVPFVAGYLVLMALLLALSLLVPQGVRPVLRGAASAGLLVLGVLAAFSIGVAVLIAAALAMAATFLDLSAKPGARSVASAVAGALVAVVSLLVGFQISWTHIECPPSGESGGTTAGFIHENSYQCSDGRLTGH